MDDDSALIDESNIDPLQPLEAVLGEVFHSAPVDQDTGPQQAAPANQQPHDDGDHLEPWEREQLERDLHSAVRQGRVDLAAQTKAKLLGIGPFDPGTYGLRRTTALADVGAPEEGGFGPYFKMNRGHMDNPDLKRVAERYALERYDDPRRARTLSGPDLDTVHSQYAQYVADNRVGKYEVLKATETRAGQREALV